MHETLRSALAAADPLAGQEDMKRQDLAQRMVRSAAREALASPVSRAPWWQRRRVLIPLGIPAVIALGGASVIIPLGIAVNGTEVDALDAEIPIAYTTVTGVDINCRAGIYFGDPNNRSTRDDELAAFVEDHDWSDIGQKIYDDALANPFVPGPDDDWEVDNQELRDVFSFNRSMGLIWEEIPAELQQTGQQAALVSDCDGQLR